MALRENADSRSGCINKLICGTDGRESTWLEMGGWGQLAEIPLICELLVLFVLPKFAWKGRVFQGTS